MARFAVSLLAAGCAAQSAWLDTFTAAQDKCGHFKTPENANLECSLNGKCEITCKDGFMFEEEDSLAYDVNCQDGQWQFSQMTMRDGTVADYSAIYEPLAKTCARATACRLNGGDCTTSGAYESLQCDKDFNCWCVDAEGTQIEGTAAASGEETPQCVGYTSPAAESPDLPAHNDWHDACAVWAKGEWYKTFDGRFFGYKASSCQMTLLESTGGLHLYQLGLDHYGRSSYDLIHQGKKQAGRLMFTGAGNSTAFVFQGQAYGVDESADPVQLADTFKVYRQNNAVVVVDLVDGVRMIFNEDSLLIRARFGLATTGICGSYDANAENDSTNAYGHVVNSIGESADTWRAVCPVTPYWSSSSDGETVFVRFMNQQKMTAFIRRIDANGSTKVVAELEYNQVQDVQVKTSEVFIAEDTSGYKYRLNGGCAFMPQEDSVVVVQMEACNVGEFVPSAANHCNAFNPVHGKVDCSIRDGVKVCALVCEDGYRSESTNLFICNLQDGTYSPTLPRGGQRYPSCISTTQKCQHLDAPINGEVSCKNEKGQLRCYPTCKEGFQFVSAIPMSNYYSCTDGKWNPYPHFPECVKQEENVNENDVGKILGVMNRGQVDPEQTGYCMTWGQHHYRTFDGKMFRFRGACHYTLVKDVLSGSFSIEVENDRDCSPDAKCSRKINIYIADTWVSIANGDDGPVVTTKSGEVLSLPNSFYSLHITRVADYIIVKEAANAWTLKWDGDESIFVRVDENLIGQTGGLCGMFDHDQNNDLMTREGDIVKSVALFANSWKNSNECPDASEETYCTVETPEGMRKSTQAIMLCSYLMDTPCNGVIDPTPYFEACKEDVCFNGNDDLASGAPCNSMAAYFRECSRHGIHIDWRMEGRCPMECPQGQEYQPCGSSCAPSCYNPDSAGCSNEHCIDGCHCPFNEYAHDGTCVAIEQCPCLYGEEVFQPRERLRRDCNQCVCLGGKFHCTENECDSVCSISKSHVRTFDGKDYSFRGECSYVVFETVNKDYSLVMINHDCSGNECGRSLVFNAEGTVIKLLAGGAVHIQGEAVTRLPVNVGEVLVERLNREFISITGKGGRMMWDQKDTIYLRMSPEHKGEFRGLCGNFNGQHDDDFTTPEGDIEDSVINFVQKWQADAECVKPPTQDSLEPCVMHEQRYPDAKEKCAIFNSADFEKCHDHINYQPYQYQCQQDYCNNPSAQVACSAATLYAMDCAKHGVIIENWRKETVCMPDCPSGQVFKECGKACFRTCGALEYCDEIECSEACVPGCQCPDDHVLSHEGKCVAQTECSCFFNGREYFAGESRTQDCNICECYKGNWQCTTETCQDKDKNCGTNKEFVDCLKPVKTTCFNMHADQTIHPHFDFHCESGCQCVDGFVLEEATGECIVAEKCPCYHGGRSYRAGESYRQDCNKCTCGIAGDWKCSAKRCRGTCKAYGDSHIESFDGKRYRFQGECEYIYAKVEGKFEISAVNEACGSKGTVCTKGINFKAGDASISVVRGSPISQNRNDAFRLRFAGLWVFITAKDLGVTLKWNRGTHMIIKVAPEYKSQMTGLCGNFDGDIQQDLVARTGIATENVLEFAHSWRSVSTCAPPTNVWDICAKNPFRKTWSTKRCSILKNKNGPFAKCHDYVDPEYYFNNCKFDACACDTGGECECLCTAVAAYAQACNAKGVAVKWRNQGFCPMQCDGGRDYNACVSACPKTCDNLGQWHIVEEKCVDECVEGCDCPKGTVLSEDGMRCVKLEECFCLEVDGVRFAEGEKIPSKSTAVESCYCMNKEIICMGLKETPDSTRGTPKPELPTPGPECPKKKVCAVRCNQLCHGSAMAYDQCKYDMGACIDACYDQVIPTCPEGQALQGDLKTCVSKRDCPCKKPSGETLGSGETCDDWDTCTRYYCYDNDLTSFTIPGSKCSCEHNSKHYGLGDTWMVDTCETCTCGAGYAVTCANRRNSCEAKPTCICEGKTHNPKYLGNDGCCDCWQCPDCGCPPEIKCDDYDIPCPQYHSLRTFNHPDDARCQCKECVCDKTLCLPPDLVTPCDNGCPPEEREIECGCKVRNCNVKCNKCYYEDKTEALGRVKGDTWTEGDDKCIDCCCNKLTGIVTCNNLKAGKYCQAKEDYICKSGDNLVSDGWDARKCCEKFRCVTPPCNPVTDCIPAVTIPACAKFETAKIQNPGECCADYKCECDRTKCPDLDDSLCANGSSPTFPEPPAGTCCKVRKCGKCEWNGIEKEVGDIWYDCDGCKKFECLTSLTVKESANYCDNKILRAAGFLPIAEVTCNAPDVLSKMRSGHKCGKTCNEMGDLCKYKCCGEEYAKCVPYKPPQCPPGDKCCSCPAPVKNVPTCSCKYMIPTGYTNTYYDYTVPKSADCPEERVIQCYNEDATCICGDCPTVDMDASCDPCYKRIVNPIPDCCNCKTTTCVKDPSNKSPECTQCIDSSGNKRTDTETWYEDPANCYPCRCVDNKTKCADKSCCHVDCTKTPNKDPSCESYESLKAGPTVNCCPSNVCKCDQNKCTTVVETLKLAVVCEDYEVGLTRKYPHTGDGCCDYVYKCVPGTTTTTYVPPQTTHVQELGCLTPYGNYVKVGDTWRATEDCEICTCNEQCKGDCKPVICQDECFPNGCPDGYNAEWKYVDDAECCYQIVNCLGLCKDGPPKCDDPLKCGLHHKLVTVLPKDPCKCSKYSCVCDDIEKVCPTIEESKIVCSGTIKTHPPVQGKCCPTYSCIPSEPEEPDCVDENQCPRVLQESWYENGDVCRVCSCCEKRNVQCFDRYCPEVPECAFNEKLMTYQIDDCCHKYVCVPQKCANVKCPEPECCEYYECSVIRTKDECCEELICECAPEKCHKRKCAPGEIWASAPTADDCCYQTCTRTTTTTTTTPDYGTTTNTPVPPQCDTCVTNNGKAYEQGQSWTEVRVVDTKYGQFTLPHYCTQCVCNCLNKNVEHITCTEVHYNSAVCKDEWVEPCEAGCVDMGVKLDGCCLKRECQCEPCVPQPPCAGPPYIPGDKIPDCPACYKPLDTYKTGPGGCCRDRQCTPCPECCPDKPICPPGTYCQELPERTCSGICKQWTCVGTIPTTTSTPYITETSTPIPCHCVYNGMPKAIGKDWFVDTYQCHKQKCSYNGECFIENVFTAPPCPAKIICKPDEHESITTDECGCETVCCTPTKCEQDCSALGFDDTATCSCDYEINTEYHACTYSKANQAYECIEVSEIQNDKCMCVHKKCECPTCDGKPTHEEIGCSLELGGQVKLIPPQTGCCCPTYECVYTTPPSTITPPPPGCTCYYNGKVKYTTDKPWEHDCKIHKCIKENGKCKLHSVPRPCDSKPNCKTGEIVCGTSDYCGCKSYTCQKPECADKCDNDHCAKNLIFCDATLALRRYIKGTDPNDACCKLYECRCDEELCCPAGDAPTCSSQDKCQTCEAKLVKQNGDCCPSWKCECTQKDNCQVCQVNGKQYAVDEYFYKATVPANECGDCQRCQCKLTYNDDGECIAQEVCDPIIPCPALPEQPERPSLLALWRTMPQCVFYRDICKRGTCCKRRIWSAHDTKECRGNLICPKVTCSAQVHIDQLEKSCTHPLEEIKETVIDYTPVEGELINGMPWQFVDNYTLGLLKDPKICEEGATCCTHTCVCNPAKCQEPSKCQNEDECPIYEDEPNCPGEPACKKLVKCVSRKCQWVNPITGETETKIKDKSWDNGDQCRVYTCHGDNVITDINRRDDCSDTVKESDCEDWEEHTFVSYSDKYNCCPTYKCKCPPDSTHPKCVNSPCKNVDCAVDYAKDLPFAPTCSAGFKLGKVKYLDVEKCCPKQECVCKDTCPDAVDPICGDCCEIKSRFNVCNCETRYCDCPKSQCTYETENDKEYGETWDKDNDCCQPCKCNKDGTFFCDNLRAKCAPKQVCDPGYCEKFVTSDKCCDIWSCVPCGNGCDDIQLGTADECKAAFPTHFPTCKSMYKVVQLTDYIAGSEECCTGTKCICKTCGPAVEPQCADNCIVVDGPAEPECGCPTKVCECKCKEPCQHCDQTCNQAGHVCTATHELDECECRINCACSCTPVCEYNGVIYEENKTGKVDWYKNADKPCYPCKCKIVNNVAVEDCTNLRCTDDLVCEDWERKQLCEEDECCNRYECVNAECPKHDTCIDIASDLGIVLKPTCKCGPPAEPTGEFVHTITLKDGTTIECCQRYECPAPTPCPDVEPPTCFGKGCKLDQKTDECGCITYTCDGCYKCEDEGVTYKSDELWNKIISTDPIVRDCCQTCCCRNDGGVTCTDARDVCEEKPTCGCGEAVLIKKSDGLIYDGVCNCCDEWECQYDECKCEDRYPTPMPQPPVDCDTQVCAHTCFQSEETDITHTYYTDATDARCNRSCKEEACVCRKELCLEKPPMCKPGESYEVHAHPHCPCCKTYSECKPEPCIYDCEVDRKIATGKLALINNCLDESNNVVTAGTWEHIDDDTTQFCSCSGKLTYGDTSTASGCADLGFIEPSCPDHCHFNVCVDDIDNNCHSYSSCICDNSENQCVWKNTKYAIGKEWYVDPGTECELCKCLCDNEGKAYSDCNVIPCPDEPVDCAAKGLCVKHSSVDACGCVYRTCEDCECKCDCPRHLPVKCGSYQKLVSELNGSCIGEDEYGKTCTTLCYKDKCVCDVCPDPGTCPDGAKAVYGRDQHDCCDVLINCIEGCKWDDEIVPFGAGDEGENFRYYTTDPFKCQPYICLLKSGIPTWVKHTPTLPTPCIEDAENLKPCEEEINCEGGLIQAYDNKDQCCWKRRCQCTQCPPMIAVDCQDPLRVLSKYVTHYLDDDKTMPCYQWECECDPTKNCPDVGSCAANCYAIEWAEQDCNCPKVITKCECLYTSTSTIIVTPTPPPQCVDEEGCARAFAETWYYHGDTCHLCTCLKNGLITCNDRSMLCEPQPTCQPEERMLTYLCDECCLTYACVIDKCFDVCGKVETPCCQAHEKVIRVDRIDENDCVCPDFICVCDPEKCIPCTEESIDCGPSGFCSPSRIVGNCNGKEAPEGGDQCDECICQCDIPVCPDVTDTSKCAALAVDLVELIGFEGLVCDGEKFVHPSKCPCHTSKGIKQPDDKWKCKCSTCQCLNGLEQCNRNPCHVKYTFDEDDTLVCPEGYTKVKHNDGCCAECIPVTDCKCKHPFNDDVFKCGSDWIEGCNTCTCKFPVDGSNVGVYKCEPEICECGCGDSVNIDAEGCCTCECKLNQCPQIVGLICPTGHIQEEYHEICDTDVTRSECCPTPRCVCDRKTCIIPADLGKCLNRKKLVVDGKDGNNCCDTYKHIECGCTYNGLVYPIGAEFDHESDCCRTCKCLADEVMDDCPKNECGVGMFMCPSGEAPILAGTDKCGCPTYVCKCTCRGAQLNLPTFQTFDRHDFKLTQQTKCHHRLSYDACNNKYEVLIDLFDKPDDVKGTPEIKHFIIKDNVRKLEAMITKDAMFYFKDGRDASYAEINLVEEPHHTYEQNDYVQYMDGEIRVFIKDFELMFRFSPSLGDWSLSVSPEFGQCTLGLCGICNGNADDDCGMIRLEQTRKLPFKAWLQANRYDLTEFEEDGRCYCGGGCEENCYCHVEEGDMITLRSDTETWEQYDDDCFSCQCLCVENTGQDFGTECEHTPEVRCYEKCTLIDELRCQPHCVDHTGVRRPIGYFSEDYDNCGWRICMGHMDWYELTMYCPWGGVESIGELESCPADREAYDLTWEVMGEECACHWRFCMCPDQPCPPLVIDCPYDHQPVFYYDSDDYCACPKVRCECIETDSCTDYNANDVCEPKDCHIAILTQRQAAQPEIGKCNAICECEYIPIHPDYCPPPECFLNYAEQCWRIFTNPNLDDCRSVVDPFYYLNICYQEIGIVCEQANEIIFEDVLFRTRWLEEHAMFAGCQTINKFAKECSCETGICRNNWRQTYFVTFLGGWGIIDYSECPIGTCDADKEWQTCGPNYVKTCENKDWYNFYYMFGFIDHTKEGCFCPDGKVLKGNKCVYEWECPVCTDCNGKARSVGEWWYSCDDVCSIMTCDCRPGRRGQVLEKPIACPEIIENCPTGHALRSSMGAMGCCEHTWCEAAECSVYVSENCAEGITGEPCGFGEFETFIFDAADSAECCPIRKCNSNDDTCDPLEDNETVINCRSWEGLQVDSQALCTCRHCVCEPNRCEMTIEMYDELNCVKGERAVVLNNGFDPTAAGRRYTAESQCCPTFTCECDPDCCREPVKCNGQDFADCTVNWLEYVPITTDSEGNELECCTGFDEICSCRPEYCPEPPTCDGPCQMLMEVGQVCCTKYDCICDPSQCPIDDQLETTCGKGYIWMTTDEVLIPAPCECCQPIFKKMCVGCYEEFCPEPLELNCPMYHINVIEKQDCCDCYVCKCDPTKKTCPSSEKLPCPVGMHAESTEVECCGTVTKCVCDPPAKCAECPSCTRLQEVENKKCPGVFLCDCIPLDFCQWEGKAHFPGAMWTPQGDLCTTCYCPSEPNVDGLFVATCNTECCGDCPLGHSRVPDPNTCCGTCVPLSCVDNENKKRAVGDSWAAVEDKCVTCTCKQGKRDIYAECFSTRRVLNEECPEEWIYRSEDGCVVECQRPDVVGGCAMATDFTGRVTVEHDGQLCESTQDYTINMCSGECVSSTVSVDGKMQRQCSCCQASQTIERTIDIKCEDGSVRKHTIELVEECSCGATQCQAEEEKPVAKPVRQNPRKNKKKNKKSFAEKALGFLGF